MFVDVDVLAQRGIELRRLKKDELIAECKKLDIGIELGLKMLIARLTYLIVESNFFFRWKSCDNE
jgi:hypothetical protein